MKSDRRVSRDGAPHNGGGAANAFTATKGFAGLFACAIAVATLLAGTAFAHGVVDQEAPWNPTASYLDGLGVEQVPVSLVQTFTPSRPLTGIDLPIAQIGEFDLIVEIRRAIGSPVLWQSTVPAAEIPTLLSPADDTPVHLHVQPALALTPGTSYLIEVRAPAMPVGDSIWWQRSSGYVGGYACYSTADVGFVQRCVDGETRIDFGFRTYSEPTDTDGDGVADDSDNCVAVANADQTDFDSDELGDACDADDDNDGTPDVSDAFPLDPAETNDTDNDWVGDNADNCPGLFNNDQADFDGDGMGDACDEDDDNDGQSDFAEFNCLDYAATLDPNRLAPDFDSDSIPDCLDSDDDNDGINDNIDSFPFDPTRGQDADGDGFDDSEDNCPFTWNADQADVDNDGIGDVCDPTNATLEVQLRVLDDPVNFALAIDGANAAVGGDGTTTGPVAISGGTRTVQLAPGTDVPFSYVTNWECHDDAGAVVAEGERQGTLSLSVPVTDGANVICVAETALQKPDLSVIATDGGGTFTTGETIEYTIEYSNLGNVTTPSTILSIWIPLHTVADLTQSTSGLACSPASGDPGANCTINVGDVPPGFVGTVDVAVTVSPLPATTTETTLHVGCTDAIIGQCAQELGIRSSIQVEETNTSNNTTNVTTSLSTPCQPGSFSASGWTPCDAAPVGFFVATAGATEATPCPLGSYQPDTGQTECFLAAVGSYVDVVGSSAQLDCPTGTSTVGLGMTSLADCLLDFDGDGLPDVVDPDDDGDGVLDAGDLCDSTRLADDRAPRQLRSNRFWSDAAGNFGSSGYTIADTGGCSASQIIDAAGLGRGHTRFGITKRALDAWTNAI